MIEKSFSITIKPHPTYNVTFIASGLPDGTRWSVSGSGKKFGYATFPNDIRLDSIYQFTVDTALYSNTTLYNPSPTSGYVYSSGTVNIKFTKSYISI